MVFNFNALDTGIMGSLDYIDGALLIANQDQAIGVADGEAGQYVVIESSPPPESNPPYVIIPLLNPGNKGWQKIAVPAVDIQPYVVSLTTDGAIAYLARIVVCEINSDGSYNLDPSGDFPNGSLICIENISPFAITFDSTGINKVVAGGSKDWFLKANDVWRG